MSYIKITTRNLKQLPKEGVNELVESVDIIVFNFPEDVLKQHIISRNGIGTLYLMALLKDKNIIIGENLNNLEQIITNYLKSKKINAKEILIIQ